MTMYDYPSLFWAALSASIFVCCVVIWKALRNPQRLLEWPVVVCVVWLYFSGYMAV